MDISPATADNVLDQALEQSTADHTEVSLTLDEEGLTRYANSTIHQNVCTRDVRLAVRVAIGRRVGLAVTNRLDGASVATVLNEAIGIAKAQADNPDFVSFAHPLPYSGDIKFSEQTRLASDAQRAHGVETVANAAAKEGYTVAGAFMTGYTFSSIANSLGARGVQQRTRSQLTAVVMGPDSSGYAEAAGARLVDIDANAVAAEAVRVCRQSAGPVSVPPGEYEVILSPSATGELIHYLCSLGLGARAYQEGRSFMNGKLGQPLVSEKVSIWDDGTDMRGLPSVFDAEGTPKQHVALIDRGVASGVVYDTMTAYKEGKESTGHALPPPSPSGPQPTNVFLGVGDATVGDMIAGTAHGLLVTRFWYNRPQHPVLTTMTGMTRDGTFLIEHGKVKGGVQNLRYTNSILELLRHVQLLGDQGHITHGPLQWGVMPWLKASKFAFTSRVE